MTQPLSPDQQTASAIIRAQLDAWGISELAPDVDKLIRQGLGSDAIVLQLQQTDAYKQRFAANEVRRKNGLAVLAPAEYVALENQYQTIMRTYGLPATFYDSRDDFAGFIGNDVAPTELQQRVQDAQTVWLSKDEHVKEAWTQFYGLSAGDAIAAILDPKEALPVVQRKVTAAQIGGQAIANDLNVGAGRAEQLADLGVTAAAAAKGYGEIGQALTSDQAIAQRFGQTVSQQDEEDARILGLASAQRKLATLQGAETGLFTERSAASTNTLNRNSSGSY
jgi:hypothetical protein